MGTLGGHGVHEMVSIKECHSGHREANTSLGAILPVTDQPMIVVKGKCTQPGDPEQVLLELSSLQESNCEPS